MGMPEATIPDPRTPGFQLPGPGQIRTSNTTADEAREGGERVVRRSTPSFQSFELPSAAKSGYKSELFVATSFPLRCHLVATPLPPGCHLVAT
jgi:hypothetical protein